MVNRMRGKNSNALASSIVIVCRKKIETSKIITRQEFIRRLKNNLHKHISILKNSNISPADLPQSSIGPGISIYSECEVMESDDSKMSLKTAIQIINRELGEEILDFDPETSFAITWFKEYFFNEKEFSLAFNIANAKGISVDELVHSGLAYSKAGKFKLLSRDELPKNWDPKMDKTLTIWECCQHLIRSLTQDGEKKTSKLLNRIGKENFEAIKELAYQLYDISVNTLKDSQEANAYNSLISVWNDLINLANQVDDNTSMGQDSFI